MNIHELIAEKTELAKTYALDGAFHSAASVLSRLAESVKEHANECDKFLNEMMATEK